MIRNHLYYSLKPLVPYSMRIATRRWFARRLRSRVAHVWPILPGSERKPVDWPGWPDGKKFAFVITHDVESARGLERVKPLAELERSLGFRSSFNFIPEGTYAVPPDLRTWLTDRGFEVGVQDLYHDGKLYRSERLFRRHAVKINRYLEEWGAVGFRSGLMHHNLDWTRYLRVQYDASTFDTDPFEPQPDGVGTIFPFWVPALASEDRGQRAEGRGRMSEDGRKNGAHRWQQTDCRSILAPAPGSAFGSYASGFPADRDGFVELPYTLPQDSTLFLLLREPTLDIWLRKLAWIAEKGGLAHVTIHPDYIQFDRDLALRTTYPISHYRKLLEHVRAQFESSYWQARPCDVTSWYKKDVCAERVSPSGTVPVAPSTASTFQDKRAAVLLYGYYASDPRPRREAETLSQAGMTVDVICLRENSYEPQTEEINGVRVVRIPLRRRRAGKLTYCLQYSWFLVASFWKLAIRSLIKPYHLVHVHNMPDFLVFSALIPKLLGAKVILDLHDPMPELMMTIFQLHRESLTVRFLRQCEKWSIRFADIALTPNIAFKRLFTSRSCPPEKVLILMNSPNPDIFPFHPVTSHDATKPRRRTTYVILYHGSLVARHGLDVAIDALEMVRTHIPVATILICGDKTPYFEHVMEDVRRRRLQKAVRYLGWRNRQQIVQAIGECDIGVIPNRLSPFTEINMPTRIFEYLALAKPVVAPRTRGIQDYFQEEEMIYFEPDNAADLARQIEFAASNPKEVQTIIERGQAIYRKHEWAQERTKMVNLVRGMLAAGSVAYHPLTGNPQGTELVNSRQSAITTNSES